MISKEDLAILIIFYKPTEKQMKNASLLAEYFKVFIVDNTPDVEASTLNLPVNVTYCPLHNNYGIARAQNEGIDIIKKKGYKGLIFLDQDSEPDVGVINGLLYAINELAVHDEKTIAVGPLIIDKETNNRYKTSQNIVSDYQKVTALISSGTIVRMDYLEYVGGMDESLFIDNVDHEWCWRAAKKGYSIYRANKVLFPHKVGNKTHHFFGIQFLEAAPARYYYKTRNTILLLRRDYVPTKWKVKNVIRLFATFFILPFFSMEPWLSFRNMLKGFWDGINNKTL